MDRVQIVTGAGGFIGGYLVILKFLFLQSIGNRPLLLLSLLLIILGVQMLVFGILADIMVKIYFDKSGNETYRIKDIIDS